MLLLAVMIAVVTVSVVLYFVVTGSSTPKTENLSFTRLSAVQVERAILAEQDLPGGADRWRHQSEDDPLLQWDWLEDCYSESDDGEPPQSTAAAGSRYVTVGTTDDLVWHFVQSFPSEVEAQSVLVTSRATLADCMASSATNPLYPGDTASLALTPGGPSGAKSAAESLVLTGRGFSQGGDRGAPAAITVTLDVARFGGTISLVQMQSMAGGPTMRPEELVALAESKLRAAATDPGSPS